MSKLETYAKFVKQRDEFYVECIRKSGPFELGPTKRGGFYFHVNDKDIRSDMSLKELKELRDLINCFLIEVVEEE